jgi:hypothetical protein
MFVELEIKFSGQTRFKLPEYFLDREFWLVRNGNINRAENSEFSISEGFLILPDSHPAMTVETIILTDE